MFGRLFALFLIVIVLMVIISAAFSELSIRRSLTAARMEDLMGQAREIAFLASRMENISLGGFTRMQTPTMNYLQWKSGRVFEDYGAYILIMDRNGRVMDNMMTAMESVPDTVQNLSTIDVTDILREVLSGKEVQTRITDAQRGMIFTVAAPWVQGQTVLGAVFIHTSVQRIEAGYRGVQVQVLMGIALASLLALLGAAFYTRAITQPLTVITRSAENMSQGKFGQRAQVTGVDEVRQLAGAFNVMAEKMERVEESRREFVANVSHELRSPVTSIHGFVQGMLDDTIPPEETKKYLGIVNDETIRLKSLIGDLLLLSRMDKGGETLRLTDYDINESIRRVLIGRMNDIEEKKLNVHLEFETDPCVARADQDRIAQVLHNLLDNAVKFAKQEGNLTIHTVMVHDTITVTFTNDGPPILPADQPHIFERFYKADKAHTAGKGTGLGLSICKQILEMHDQSIRLLPTEKDVSFLFTLRPGEWERS